LGTASSVYRLPMLVRCLFVTDVDIVDDDDGCLNLVVPIKHLRIYQQPFFRWIIFEIYKRIHGCGKIYCHCLIVHGGSAPTTYHLWRTMQHSYHQLYRVMDATLTAWAGKRPPPAILIWQLISALSEEGVLICTRAARKSTLLAAAASISNKLATLGFTFTKIHVQI
jgi:hypothetical protein